MAAWNSRSQDGREGSGSPGVFGPVDTAAPLDDLFEEQLRMAAALKDKSERAE